MVKHCLKKLAGVGGCPVFPHYSIYVPFEENGFFDRNTLIKNDIMAQKSKEPMSF